MASGRVYPHIGDNFASAPPPGPGAFDNVSLKDEAPLLKDEPLPVPATYRGPKRRRSRCCCCLIWMCSVLTIIVVALGTAVLVFWLVVRPKTPKYEVNNVLITGSLVNSSTVSTDTTFQVVARNPNKKIGFYYDEIKVNIESMGLTIGEGYLPTFYQGHRNTTIIQGDFKSPAIFVPQATQTALLAAQSAGKVPLEVNAHVKVRIKVGAWKSPKIKARVRCDINVNLSITSGSQIVDKHCKVKY